MDHENKPADMLAKSLGRFVCFLLALTVKTIHALIGYNHIALLTLSIRKKPKGPPRQTRRPA
ncbi:MAG: hypothetical protein ACXV7J_16190 [Methylomonas sp.]